jgi:hypothetical protein
MKVRSVVALLFLFSLFVSVAVADIANPDGSRRGRTRKPSAPSAELTPFRIISDENLSVPELRVPRKMAAAFQAEGEPLAAGTISTGGGPSPIQLMVGGVLLSCAMVAGGLWLARNRGMRPAKAMPAVLAVGLVGVAGSAVLANIAPFPKYYEAGTLPYALRPPKNNSQGENAPFKELVGKVKVVVVNEGTEIVLVVPTKTANGD